jgi:hypothetical protein
MAQKNRAQMLTDITTNIFNNVINFITGQNAQDRLVNLLDSSPNIISDKDQPNGYVGLDAVGSMFSSYYNENISRADLVTLLTTNTAIGYKLYQVNDAVGATKILLVIADSNITLYPFAIDLTTAEIGTYNINTDTFTVLVGSGNASIISTTVTGLQGLQTTSSLSTTTLYNVTDAVGNTLILQVYAIANNTNVVYAIDVASGTIGTYNITTDTFTATTSTPDLQQVTDVGFATTNKLSSDDGAGNATTLNNGVIDIATGNTGVVSINASQATAGYFAQLPDKLTGTETFAMLSDLTGLGGITKATAAGTDTYTTTIVGVTGYVDGDTYLIRFTNGNTTAATLNINTLGAKSLYRNNDGALIGGDIWDGAEMLCVFNSTLDGFQCIGTSPNSLFAYVTNAESVSITKGQVVYAFGGTGDRMTVKLANNTSDATSARTVGVVFSSSIAANQKGIIILQGLIDGLSILGSPFVDGDSVYLGATNGAITRTKPFAPNHLVYVATVTTASAGSAGRMYVKVQNGYELDELHDVSAQTPVNKDGLFYNSTTGLWTARQVAATDINANVSNTEFGYLDGVTSNIQTQINSLSRIASVGDGTAVTGTTNNTLCKTLTLSANARGANDAPIVFFQIKKTGTAGGATVRLYWNTTASLTGAILLASTGSNNTATQFTIRHLGIEVADGTGNGTQVFNATTAANNCYGAVAAALTTAAINWTVSGFLIVAIQNASTGDSSNCNIISLT